MNHSTAVRMNKSELAQLRATWEEYCERFIIPGIEPTDYEKGYYEGFMFGCRVSFTDPNVAKMARDLRFLINPNRAPNSKALPPETGPKRKAPRQSG